MFPKLISIGSFFIPTYGTLVAIGFLAALWIIIRLAKRASLPAETDHQSGHLLRARRTGRREAVHDPVRFQRLLERSAIAVLAEHAASRRRLSRRFPGGLRHRHPVHATASICRSWPPATSSRPASRSAKPSAASDVFRRAAAGAFATHRALGCHVPQSAGRRTDRRAARHSAASHAALRMRRRRAHFSRSCIFESAKTHTAGTILGWYLALYSAARFVIEFFRFHEQGLHFGLSYTQWISLATLAAGVGVAGPLRGGTVHSST